MNQQQQQIQIKAPNLKFVREFKDRVCLCVGGNGYVVYKEPRSDGEYDAAHLVNKVIDSGYNDVFHLLKLPRFFDIQKEEGYLLMEYCGDNTDIIRKWKSEYGGGKQMGVELSGEMASMLYDFSLIPVDGPVDGIGGINFDWKEAKKVFSKRLKEINKEGYIDMEQQKRAAEMISKRKDMKPLLIFNNGDYYPRNLVMNGDRVYVVDWEVWNKDFRVNMIDTVENVAAFAYIHMWDNKAWQLNFLKELRGYFYIKKEDFRVAALLKSLDQFFHFGKAKNRAGVSQLEIFKNFLDDKYLDLLWEESSPGVSESIKRVLRSIERFIKRKLSPKLS